MEAEEEAVLAADAQAQGGGAIPKLDDAGKRGGCAPGEAADEREGGAGGVAGEFLQGLAELAGELDEAQGLVAGGLLGEVVRGFVVAGRVGYGGVGGRGIALAQGFEVVARLFQLAAEGGAFGGAFAERALERVELLKNAPACTSRGSTVCFIAAMSAPGTSPSIFQARFPSLTGSPDSVAPPARCSAPTRRPASSAAVMSSRKPNWSPAAIVSVICALSSSSVAGSSAATARTAPW